MIKSYKTFEKEKKAKPFSPQVKKGAALSMTGELYWNFNKGIFEINADMIQGAAGFLSAEKEPFRFKNLRVSSKNTYSSVFLYSLNNMPISESSGLILNTAARTDNSGARYSPAHTSVIYGGTKPIIVEPVYADIKVTLNKFKKIKVYKLDANYYKAGGYDNYTVSGNVVSIKTDEKSKTLNYYIDIER